LEAAAQYIAPRRPLREQIEYHVRVFRVLARTEFKLKYAGSALGYVWSLARPLLYFAVLWVVFGRLFKSTIPRFPVYLVIGVALYTFLGDAVSSALPSIVQRGAVLRRIAFPSLLIPLATTTSALTTFVFNCVGVGIFVGASGVQPRLQWVLLLPLVLELYLFVFGVALICATLYVRFRDVGQIWEVLSSVLFFSSPVMYPITILPGWAREVIAFNPLVQIMQDSRELLLGRDPRLAGLLGIAENRVFPIAIALGLLCFALWLHRRNAARLPELA
jgi:ABC-2 type transport system permease protein